MSRRAWQHVAMFALGFAAATGVAVAASPAADAHPLGNFTVNTYDGIVVRTDGVQIDSVLDMAELPTFQLIASGIDADHDGTASDPELGAWARRACVSEASALHVVVDGHALSVHSGVSRPALRPGAGGLKTLRLECALNAPADLHGRRTLDVTNSAYTDRIGWREMTAQGDGMVVSGNVPTVTTSQRLLAYPSDLLRSPLDLRSAHLDVHPGGARLAASRPFPASGSAANDETSRRGVDALTAAFTDFVGRPSFGFPIAMVAVLLSVLLGAAHAFAPGHGKTVMAAYLVGERGSLRHAAIIAGSVTVTHTAGVLVLGGVLTTAVALAPVQLYAWLGIGSGLLLAGVGASLLLRGWRGRATFADHSHPHPHAHPHVGNDASHDSGHDASHDSGHSHGASHSHSHGHSHGDRDGHSHGTPRIRRTALMLMGFAGGLVPSPSAVVVLLGAVSLGRTWFGILLVLGYGLGMAITLAGLGVALARWGGRWQRRSAGRFATWTRRALPLVTAGVIVLVGLGIAVQAGVVVVSAG